MTTFVLPKAKCHLCGVTWTPRVEHPTRCPNCMKRDWDKPAPAKG